MRIKTATDRQAEMHYSDSFTRFIEADNSTTVAAVLKLSLYNLHSFQRDLSLQSLKPTSRSAVFASGHVCYFAQYKLAEAL